MFLTHLAIAGKVLASIRNPAKSALRFLYRQVIRIDESWLTDLESVREGKRLPGVLTVAEVQAVPCSHISSNGSISSSSIVGLLHLAMGSSLDRAFQSRRDRACGHGGAGQSGAFAEWRAAQRAHRPLRTIRDEHEAGADRGDRGLQQRPFWPARRSIGANALNHDRLATARPVHG